jgi:hypothetical protein
VSKVLTSGVRRRVQPDGLAAVHRVRRRVDSANEEMGQVILQAFDAGSSLRAIAAAAGLSHEKVRAIIAAERKRRALREQHVTIERAPRG